MEPAREQREVEGRGGAPLVSFGLAIRLLCAALLGHVRAASFVLARYASPCQPSGTLLLLKYVSALPTATELGVPAPRKRIFRAT